MKSLMLNLPHFLRLQHGGKRREVEDSIPLRVISTALAMTGVLSAVQLTEAPLWVVTLSLTGSVLGSYLSYLRRNSNNLILKIWISVGIIAVASSFFQELIVLAYANIADARIPLVKMLMLLIALHCFDLPRRRDLNVSAMVGLTLLTAASSLSRQLGFSAYIVVFIALSVLMFQLDSASRALSRWKVLDERNREALAELSPAGPQAGAADLPKQDLPKQDLQKQNSQIKANALKASSALGLKETALSFVTVMIVSVLCFVLSPRMQSGFSREFRLEGTLPFQLQMEFLNKANFNMLSMDGSVKANPDAFYGFAEVLDTNYRGKLTDEIVLRVSASYGTYLRGMAYDTYDGRVWKMKRPRETKEILSNANHSFSIPMRGAVSGKLDYKTVNQVIYVEADSSNLLVCASVPYQIHFPASMIQLDTYGSLRSPVGIHKDMVYTVFSRVPVYVSEYMRKLKPEKEKPDKERRFPLYLDSYLQLPELPEELKTLSRNLAGEGNNFAKAERLSNYLQSHCKYTLDTAPTQGKLDTVSDFVLNTRRGYCEHFASALVVMCRSQGIPARLVTGYAPGEYNPLTGYWEVRLNNAHAWAEIYVPRCGWVPMDATPGSLINQHLEARSVISYLFSLMEPWLEKAQESAAYKSFESFFQSVFVRLAAIVSAFTGSSPLILGAGLAAALLASVLAFYPGLRKLVAGSKKSPDKNFAEESSREFARLCLNLSKLGIERQYCDTAEDLLKKSIDNLENFGDEGSEFLACLDKFTGLYGEIRFGREANKIAFLKQEGQKLERMSEKMSENMAKQRKTAGIS